MRDVTRRAGVLALWCFAVPTVAGALCAGIGWFALARLAGSVDSLGLPRIGLYLASATILSIRLAWAPGPLWLRIPRGCLGFFWCLCRTIAIEMAVLGYLGYGTCGEEDFPLDYVLDAILNPLFPFLSLRGRF